jgi:hypothetical protein
MPTRFRPSSPWRRAVGADRVHHGAATQGPPDHGDPIGDNAWRRLQPEEGALSVPGAGGTNRGDEVAQCT